MFGVDRSVVKICSRITYADAGERLGTVHAVNSGRADVPVITTTSHHLTLSPRAMAEFEEQITLVSPLTNFFGGRRGCWGKQAITLQRG